MFWTRLVKGIAILFMVFSIIISVLVGWGLMNTLDDNVGFTIIIAGVALSVISVAAIMMICEISLNIHAIKQMMEAQMGVPKNFGNVPNGGYYPNMQNMQNMPNMQPFQNPQPAPMPFEPASAPMPEPDENDTWVCECGEENLFKSNFCKRCGAKKTLDKVWICKKCGKSNPNSATVCKDCGTYK